MKKLFLLFAASALVFSAVAQKECVKRNTTHAKKCVYDDKNSSLPVSGQKSTGSSVFTTSGNGYTLLSGRKLTSDQQSKTSMYVARAGGAFGATSNDIKMSYTSDYGTSFDSVLFANTILHRYPGGILFRTNSGLYTMCAGPVTGGSGWTDNYIFTSKIDGTEAFDTTIANPPAAEVGSFMMNDDMAYLPTGEFFMLGEKSGPVPDYNHVNYTIWKLQWNEGTKHLNYVSEQTFTPLLSTVQPPVQPFGMAFSQDGSVGYFWVNGMDSITRPNQSTQPLVWKTTDKGTTWNQMPIYDFSQVQEFKDYVWPTLLDSTVMRPVFSYGYTTSDKSMPGTVDANGNLHLMVNVQGGYSIHPDSLTYSFMYEENKIFDLYTTATGWEAKYIDTLATEVDPGDAAAFGDFTLDHRFHISRTEDGTKIFYAWTDGPGTDATTNILPDMYAHGKDFANNTSTGTKNFTLGTALESSCLYMNASNTTLFENNTYTIPTVIISGATPESEIQHLYLSGVEFASSTFISVNDVDKTIANITNIYPNPTNGISSTKLTLTNSSEVSLQVVNLMGQVVYTENYGHKAAGVHTLSVDASDLTSGVYFVTVKAGNATSTSKMIVR